MTSGRIFSATRLFWRSIRRRRRRRARHALKRSLARLIFEMTPAHMHIHRALTPTTRRRPPALSSPCFVVQRAKRGTMSATRSATVAAARRRVRDDAKRERATAAAVKNGHFAACLAAKITKSVKAALVVEPRCRRGTKCARALINAGGRFGARSAGSRRWRRTKTRVAAAAVAKYVGWPAAR